MQLNRTGFRRMTFARFGFTMSALLLAAATATAQTTWNAAANGDWNTSGNWSDDVPNNNAANLTPTGDDYTVTVNAPPAHPFTDLTVQNAGDNTTTLDLNAGGFKSDNGLITIGRGATVKVNTGGVMEYEGDVEAADIVRLGDGALWHVDGGSVLLTNIFATGSPPSTRRAKSIRIGTTATESTLRISSGEFRMIARPGDFTNMEVLMDIGAANGRGRLEMTGGSLTFQGHSQGVNSYFRVACAASSRGHLELSGDAFIDLYSMMEVASGVNATGTVVLAGNSVLRQNHNSRTGIADRDGAHAEITVKDNATFDFYVDYLSFGGNAITTGANRGGGVGILNVMNNATSRFNRVYFGGLRADTSVAYGELNLSGGTIYIGTSMHVGLARSGVNSVGIGVANVSGGFLEIEASNGLSIGSVHGDAVGVSFAHGTLNLSGGLIYNDSGAVHVGSLAGATGVVHQVAGDFIIDSNLATRSMYVGYGGGDGTYRISGGGFSSRAPVFAGGVTGDGGSGSQGLLEVTGGSFGVTNTVTVGQNGTGTVSISGGAFYASDLDLASGDATLRFGFESGTTGDCTISGAMTIHADAKLEIDTTGAASNVKYTLVSCDSRVGNFDLANISVLGGQTAWVDQDTDQNIYFTIPTGTVIMLR